ncbi:MAG: hypothetical protein UMU76_05470 [Prosthecochloris sp.]|uniref:hypothetical protein n=1 Tax=Prosthecochloris sp. ZM_2 TaxID=2045206 RepID=UPI000DF84911|nr:hypothetical protein [Prosthecochloris sp. ZM_2]MEC9486931.1 hypothetical protein [Prosthecochloris sp.]RNA66089.1 hypothetical protein CR163_000985 [Prosthecochloris sp. ZM_2]RNA66386.1 hypothetical protein CR163_000735 [Prosthecochloris sp. ZM_2]
MFSKEAYKQYFLQILELEEQMVREAEELAGLVDDPEIRQVMQRVMMDEQRHVRYVQELLELIDPED